MKTTNFEKNFIIFAEIPQQYRIYSSKMRNWKSAMEVHSTGFVYLHFPIMLRCDFLLRTPRFKTSQTSILHFLKKLFFIFEEFLQQKGFSP